LRAVLVNARESLVDERRRLGIHRQDERWQGEWHFVNPPKSWRPVLNGALYIVLAPLARAAGLVPTGDSMGVFADFETDWRIPDQVYVQPEQIVEEGVTGAALVVELYSPGDESYAKLPFYAAWGIPEALIVHRDRRFELYRLSPECAYQPVEDGRCTTLGVTFTTVEGAKLRIDWDGGSAEV
jgi:hypothetical protein